MYPLRANGSRNEHLRVIVHFDQVRRRIVVIVDEANGNPRKVLTIYNLGGEFGEHFDDRMSFGVSDGTIADILPLENSDAIARLL